MHKVVPFVVNRLLHVYRAPCSSPPENKYMSIRNDIMRLRFRPDEAEVVGFFVCLLSLKPNWKVTLQKAGDQNTEGLLLLKTKSLNMNCCITGEKRKT